MRAFTIQLHHSIITTLKILHLILFRHVTTINISLASTCFTELYILNAYVVYQYLNARVRHIE